ncbi:type I polyketide synthase [Streptomyces hoynatensis]|uniref:SDR family NAD(P)-dependent oxidoreductase n=1 Tax=Streptomyces hoynatensis TaxID=1141874 RepID=A0A3A9YUN8_9ACTN|nr:type I polyketide synthase [Streptomyces hoynatensis]RKN39509.1 SDR family NAD(P)-dependent oxidoreductase [Streptomyces hoynatensis]
MAGRERREEIADWLAARVAELLGLPEEEVPTGELFTSLGLSSLQALELSDDLQQFAAVELPPTILYDYPTIDDIAAEVARRSGGGDAGEAARGEGAGPAPATTESSTHPAPAAEAAGAAAVAGEAPAADREGRVPIAIVGIGCRLPGGVFGPDGFWRLLTEGRDAITEVPANRWDAEAFYDPDYTTPDRMNTKWGGFLDDVEGFDAEFFGISAREAARVDPQQRLALEVAWEAIEDAGLAAEHLAGTRTGVFMGVSTFDHATAVFGSPEDVQPYDGTGGALSIVANRLSYNFNLRGPSISVDTACSSSLVATHLAAQALRAGEADIALAGGVNVITSPRIALSFSQGGLTAPDGRCKAFDHRADGYVRSEGVGVVVLKPLARAVADGDRIYAVLLGGAVNQDGRTNGLTAPNGQAQEDVLRAACEAAGVDPAEVDYVEAHGTGTAVGDPIEINALNSVHGQGRPAARPLLVGSAKSNLGHLEAAAGVTGLIKAALALHHRRIPPSIHFEKPNPLLGLDRIPIGVVAAEEPWPRRGDGTPPALAGVSSFGFGGTNAHLVLTAAPEPGGESGTHGEAGTFGEAGEGAARHPGTLLPVGGAPVPRLVPLSAKTAEALRRRATAWAGLAAAPRAAGEANGAARPDDWVGRAAAAAALRQTHAPHRAAVVAADPAELAAAMAAIGRGEHDPATAGPRAVGRRAPRVAMVFSGQGSQWDGMGRELAAALPAFREAVLEADAAVATHLGRSLWSDEEGLVAGGIDTVQPALFLMQVGLAAAWRAWGVVPDAVVGHSMGEVAAACVSGALSVADAAAVICERSRLLTSLTGAGGLALLELPADEARALIAGREHEVSVAAVNGPRATVLSGTEEALDDILATLPERGVFARRIAEAVAGHSPQVEPLRPRLREALTGIAPRPAATRLYSTVTGEPVEGTALDPEYWSRNMREPVLFGPVVRRLLADGYDAFVEISPHPVLARPIADYLDETGAADAMVVSSMRRGEDSVRTLLGALGTLYTAGLDVDWSALHPGTPRHVDLPGHGWRHRRFPIARPAAPKAAAPAGRPAATGGDSLLGRRIPVGVEPQLKLWDLPFGLDTHPEIADHVAEDLAIVPGAYWLTAAAQAAAGLAGGTAAVLSDVTIDAPYLVGDDAATDATAAPEALQLGVRPSPEGARRFTVTSVTRDGRPTVHATGVLGDAPEAPREAADQAARRVAELTRDPAENSAGAPDVVRVAAADYYPRLEGAGLRYGPRFRGIAALWTVAGEAVARLRLPDDLDPALPGLHPALLDACFQSVAACAPGALDDGALPLPVGADRVWSRVGGARLHEGWCHVRLVRAEPDLVVADLTVLDEDGEPRWHAAGFRARITAGRRPPQAGRLYDVHWQQAPAPQAAAGPGGWLILTGPEGPKGLGAALAARLTRAGDRCLTGEDLDGLLAQADAADWAPTGVLDARLPAGPQADVPAALRRRTAEALALINAVAERDWRAATPRVWLLTAGAQPDAAPGGAPTDATLWGLGRTFANERSAPGATVLDLDLPPGAGDAAVAGLDLDPVVALLRSAEPPTQAAVRGAGHRVPVLRPLARAAGQEAGCTIRPDRTYLVTGGLGALGLRTARWLAESGAGHLLLLGRTAPSPEAEAELAALRAAGAGLRVALADAADPAALRAALRAEAGEPPLGGVFHLAGVLEDALFADLDEAALGRALDGKAAGAWNLHELTRDQPVEAFVLFSSLAGLLGSPGQGAYAAANCFLDALAHHRAALGLPAQSIAWGTWAGTGLAVEVGAVERLAARGMPALAPDTAVALLDEAVRSGRPHLAAGAFDPVELGRTLAWPAARELLARVIGSAAAEGGAARRGAVREAVLAATGPEQRRDLLGRYLVEQVAQVLGAAPGGVPADVPFQSLGFDSLMAIELRGRLEVALDTRLSATLVYAHPTADALTDALLARIAPQAEGPAPAAQQAAAPAAEAPGELPDDLSDLDDDEVASLLAAELDALGETGAFDQPDPSGRPGEMEDKR